MWKLVEANILVWKLVEASILVWKLASSCVCICDLFDALFIRRSSDNKTIKQLVSEEQVSPED